MVLQADKRPDPDLLLEHVLEKNAGKNGANLKFFLDILPVSVRLTKC